MSLDQQNHEILTSEEILKSKDVVFLSGGGTPAITAAIGIYSTFIKTGYRPDYFITSSGSSIALMLAKVGIPTWDIIRIVQKNDIKRLMNILNLFRYHVLIKREDLQEMFDNVFRQYGIDTSETFIKVNNNPPLINFVATNMYNEPYLIDTGELINSSITSMGMPYIIGRKDNLYDGDWCANSKIVELLSDKFQRSKIINIHSVQNGEDILFKFLLDRFVGKHRHLRENTNAQYNLKFEIGRYNPLTTDLSELVDSFLCGCRFAEEVVPQLVSPSEH